MDIGKDMKRRPKTGWLSGFTLVAALAAIPHDDASACQPDPYIGSICFTGAGFCPRGYASAHGYTVSIVEYTLLYSLLGTIWGGNGSTNFMLPDLRGRELVHHGGGPGLYPVYHGWYPGLEADYIGFFEMPMHTHDIDLSASLTATLTVSDTVADQVSPQGNYFAVTPTGAENYSSTAHTVMAASAVQTQLSGSGILETGTSGTGLEEVSRIGPQLGLLMCVAWDGQYPPRS